MFSIFCGSVKTILRVKRSFGVILAVFGHFRKIEKARTGAISWADIGSVLTPLSILKISPMAPAQYWTTWSKMILMLVLPLDVALFKFARLGGIKTQFQRLKMSKNWLNIKMANLLSMRLAVLSIS